MTRPHRIVALGFAASLLAPAALGAQSDTAWSILLRPRTHAPAPTRTEITAADLMTRLFQFADDSMGGRNIATKGNALGVAYIAREAARLGLRPGGDSGTFFQTLPYFERPFDEATRLIAGGTPLTPWSDFVPRDVGPGARSIDGVPVVFGGTWGQPGTLIPVDSAQGKLVVVAVQAGERGSGAIGIPNRQAVSAYFRKAAGIAVASLDMISPAEVAYYRQPLQLFRSGTYPPVASYLYVTRRAAALIMGGPLEAVAGGAAGRPVGGTPRFLERLPEYPARNVVAILPGSDPALQGEFVALGAHNDHLGTGTRPVAHDSIYVVDHLYRLGGAEDPVPRLAPAQVDSLNAILMGIRRRSGGTSARPDSIFNGADDDGSGSMGLLEIAEWFAGRPVAPKRSLVFVWHVGEEEGLYGSEFFTDHPAMPRDSIVAQLNIDMIGRGAATDVTGRTKLGVEIHGDPDYLQLIGSRRLSTELGDLAETVNAEGKHGLHFDYALDANGHPMEIYCRSDHYEYARYGIPIVFFTTGGHADYHQVTDEAQYIDYGRMERVTRYVADLATRVANLDHRPLVDQPKPDPNGICRQ